MVFRPWSLWHEIRISLVFPKIAHWVMSSPPSTVLLLSAAVYLASETLRHVGGEAFTPSFSFGCVFVWGAMIAKYRSPLCSRFARLQAPQKAFLVIAALALYNARWELAWFGWKESEPVNAVACLGCILTVAVIIMSQRADACFRRRLPLWLGKISYSLYLIHMPIISTLVYSLNRFLPYWAIGFIGVWFSIAAAAVLNKFIEQPSIQWGKALARLWQKRMDSGYIAGRNRQTICAL